MKKFYAVAVLLLIAILPAFAQKVNGVVRGALRDSLSASPLADATVSVIQTSDSSLIAFTVTGPNGEFEMKNLAAGDYKLVATYSGLQTYKKFFSITAAEPTANLGVLKMDRIYKSMEEVVVKDEAPVRVKGDTLAYNADMFKTKPNATVEDLLKKLPGVQVEKDGTVKAQGEQVQKVYVDGKEFFGTDPKLATKNLNADMIDQVEVYDDMSEQAKFNKIDDGSRTKAINLKLKKDKKKGIFGKAYAGYGTKERYDMGLNANFFKGAMQASVIAKTNNTNNIGFTLSDMLGMFSGGGGGGMMSGGSGGGFSGGMGGMSVVNVGRGGMGGFSGGMSGLNLGSTGNGITASTQLGLNYRDTWSPKLEGNGSYFFNHAKTTNDRVSFRQNFFTADSLGLNNEQVWSRNENFNHRFNYNLVWSIDSFNSIIYQPSVNFQKSQSFSDDTLSSKIQKGSASYLANLSRNLSNSEGKGYNWSNNVIWRHKWRRPGRTLAVTFNNTLSTNDRDRYSVISSRLYNQSGFKYREINTNNLNTTRSTSNNYGIGFSYTEPLARDKVLEVNYRHSNNQSSSDRYTYDYNTATGRYDQAVDTLSNVFENGNVSDRAGVNFRMVKKKYNWQIGAAVQQTKLTSDNKTRGQNVQQTFRNFFPTAVFQYQFQRSRSLRINYNGRTNQPTISQLQDVTDVSSYPYIYKGNPNLKQEFSNNVMLSYNFFDMLRFRNLFAFVNFSNTMNKIARTTENLGGGVQRISYANVDGVYSLSGNFNMGFPIKKMKGGNFNATSRILYNRDASVVDNVLNYSKNLNVGEDLRLSYNYKSKLDLGITASVNYNNVAYTISKQNNASYFTHNYSADATYTFPKNFILSTDFDYTFNTGRTAGFNQDFAIWNASFAKQVFKNKRGEIKVSVFDLLNQNTNVTRNVSETYLEDVRNSTLQRYFMLTFTYNINRMGGRGMHMPAMMERATRGIRMQ